MASPLSQFEIKTIVPLELFGYDISFTNSSLAMLVTVSLVFLFLIISLKNSSIIPSKSQSALEVSYEFISGMIDDNIGKEGLRYFSFIFSLFMFILLGNLLGMLIPLLDESYNGNVCISFSFYSSYNYCNL